MIPFAFQVWILTSRKSILTSLVYERLSITRISSNENIWFLLFPTDAIWIQRMYVCMYVCIYGRLSVCLHVCLSLCLSVYLYDDLPTYLHKRRLLKYLTLNKALKWNDWCIGWLPWQALQHYLNVDIFLFSTRLITWNGSWIHSNLATDEPIWWKRHLVLRQLNPHEAFIDPFACIQVADFHSKNALCVLGHRYCQQSNL